MREKAGVALVVVLVIGIFLFNFLSRAAVDTSACKDYLSVMQETHNLSSPPTAGQQQLFKQAVQDLASGSHGDLVRPEANAAAVLLADTNTVGASSSAQTGDAFLRINREVGDLTAACNELISS